jgi:hypothetical protein
VNVSKQNIGQTHGQGRKLHSLQRCSCGQPKPKISKPEKYHRMLLHSDQKPTKRVISSAICRT